MINGVCGISIVGDLAYVATDKRFTVFDVSDPGFTVVVGYIQDPRHHRASFIEDPTYSFISGAMGTVIAGDSAYFLQSPGLVFPQQHHD